MDIERLKRFKTAIEQQKGQRYPLSNQIVVCGVMITDKDKALSIMQDKGAVITQNRKGCIKWELNNEEWVWLDWNFDIRGRRFYKIIIDQNIDEIFFPIISAHCSLYCCSVEIV